VLILTVCATAVSWLQSGGTCTGVSFTAAGMQTLVTTVRNQNAKNIIILSGVSYANSITGWLANRPSDPATNLVAGMQIYDYQSCSSQSCWDGNVGSLSASVHSVACDPIDAHPELTSSFAAAVYRCRSW
jgi:endoglucanase